MPNIEISIPQSQSQILYDEDANIPACDLSGDEIKNASLFMGDLRDNRANIFFTTTTLIKLIIATGILSLPYTVSSLGWAFSIIIFTLAVLLTQFSVVLLLNSKNLAKHSSYSTILYEIKKNRLLQAICLVLTSLNSIGVCLAQLTIYKQTIRKIVEDLCANSPWVIDQFYISDYMIIIYVSFVMVPLSITKKIQGLKIFAFFGFLGIVVFFVSFISNFIDHVIEDGWNFQEVSAWPRDWYKVAAVTPNLLLAIGFQQNLFYIFKGMKDGTDQRMKKSSIVGVGFCGILYVTFGLFAYLLYGDKIGANFLLSLPINSTQPVLYYGINFGYLISVFFSFPCNFFCARNNFIGTIDLITNKKNNPINNHKSHQDLNHAQMERQILNPNRYQNTKAFNRFLFLSLLLYGILIGLSFAIVNLETIFNIVGAITTTAISTILPCLFYVLLVDLRGKNRTTKYYFVKILLIVMIPYSIFSVVANNT